MAITACTSATEYKLYSGTTETIHPEMNTVEWSGGHISHNSVYTVSLSKNRRCRY